MAMVSRIRVLLIDDEELYAESLAKVLTRRGMEVSTARDGKAGLDWLGDKRADVIVLDLKMPGMDGLATLQEIRKRDSMVPVIMLTGHIDLEKVTMALEGGVGDILLKPCPVDSLAAAIENAAERKAAAQGLKDIDTGGASGGKG
jgi:DNA-binding response OmpR family regulator